MSHAQSDMTPLPDVSNLRKITQDYFDQIVEENVDEFEMSTEEAIEDAINQCKSQKCDISTICKYSQDVQNELINGFIKLNDLIPVLLSYSIVEMSDPKDNVKVTMDSIEENLQIIKKKFDKDLSFRVLATRMVAPNAFTIFMKFLGTLEAPSVSSNQDLKNKFNDLTESFLSTFEVYISNQSDIIDIEGLNCLIKLTDSIEDDNFNKVNILLGILKCINSSCKLCESNRQHYVDHGLGENLMKLFKKHKTNDLILNITSKIIRSLLLDDDIRHAFGKSHEHAKFIAAQLNGIDVLLKIGIENEDNLSDDTLANLMLTLSRLAVRNEFCQEICDKGGLQLVIKCIQQKHLKHVSLIRSSLSLLKSICNNDKVKREATKSNATELIKSVLDKYSYNTQICEVVCGALHTLMLRNLESCEHFFNLELHRNLVQLLVVHLKKPTLVKPCVMALRNAISRSKQQNPKLIDLQIEEILRTIWADKEMISCYDEIKALLRDLDLNANLQEKWKGTGVCMQYD